MNEPKQCVFNWSGGKDSTLALHYALQDPLIEVKYLLTTVSEQYNRVSMHGVRESLLIKQAKSIGIPLYQIKLPDLPDMDTYNSIMHQHLSGLKNEGITDMIYGDIFLEDLRQYREKSLQQVGLKAIFPLWGRNTRQLVDEFIKLDYKTVIVCTQENLHRLCGKVIDADLIEKLPIEIDPCGENGEFHTFAFKGQIFKKDIHFKLGGMLFKKIEHQKKEDTGSLKRTSIIKNTGFWYIDLID